MLSRGGYSDESVQSFGRSEATARAALEALAEISKKTQVLFFTHHERLVGLAEQLADASHTIVVHRLDYRS